jgi:hypothetical protein
MQTLLGDSPLDYTVGMEVPAKKLVLFKDLYHSRPFYEPRAEVGIVEGPKRYHCSKKIQSPWKEILYL